MKRRDDTTLFQLQLQCRWQETKAALAGAGSPRVEIKWKCTVLCMRVYASTKPGTHTCIYVFALYMCIRGVRAITFRAPRTTLSPIGARTVTTLGYPATRCSYYQDLRTRGSGAKPSTTGWIRKIPRNTGGNVETCTRISERARTFQNWNVRNSIRADTSRRINATVEDERSLKTAGFALIGRR